MKTNIDIAVCYHKQSPIFENDALHPMHLGRAISKINLKMRVDNTGKNISKKNKFYAEETAFYWLWKNSKAKIKGLMHYRRLLDLNNPGDRDKNVAFEDITNTTEYAKSLGLTSDKILHLMRDADVLIRKQLNVHNWFAGNIEEQYKACHTPEFWDMTMDIIKRDFPKIAPAAVELAGGHFGWFQNIVIMKGDLFDKMCQFRFAVLEKLEKMIDPNRLEITLGEPTATRYIAFIGERLTMVFVKYLQSQGKKIREFPVVSIVPRGSNVIDAKTDNIDAYVKKENQLTPAFKDKNAVAIMLATNDNYAPYCGVMLRSIIENADSKRKYDIIIVGNMNNVRKRQLESMATSNVSIRILDINPFLAGIDLSIFQLNSHFSIETYYRFFIPKIFAAYKKVLYLDVDMVVMHDVAELYDTNMGKNWWAVTREKAIPVLGFIPGEYTNTTFIPYIKNVLKMDSPFDYFQAGVMIWNVEQCIKDNVTEKCIEKLKEIHDPIYVDQSIMNSVANGKHIVYLPGYWNVLWFWAFYGLRNSEALDSALYQLKHAYIIHFASGRKPWKETTLPNAEKFWHYARQTPFYEEFITGLIGTPTQAFAVPSPEFTQQKINKTKQKIKIYKLLQGLTFGLVKIFKKRKQNYRAELNRLKAI